MICAPTSSSTRHRSLQHVGQRRLGLLVPLRGGLNGCLRAGQLGLDILDLLAAGRSVERRGDALIERSAACGRIGIVGEKVVAANAATSCTIDRMPSSLARMP